MSVSYIYDFQYIQDLLKCTYSMKYKENSVRSIRGWARHMNLSGVTNLSAMLAGHRIVSYEVILAYIRNEKFKQKETTYIKILYYKQFSSIGDEDIFNKFLLQVKNETKFNAN